jgi:hypothetical protein
MAVPPYAAFHAVGGRDLAWGAWLSTLFAVGVPSAIACVFLAGLLRAWGVRDGPSYAVAAAWALATLAWPYGTLLYGHQTVASLLVIGFALVAMPRARGETPTPRVLAIAGFVLGAAVVVEYPAALACLAIGAYATWAYGWRRALWIVAGAVPPAIAAAAYHWMLFGSPTTTAYEFSTQKNRSQGFFMGIGVPKPTALWHILLSDYRGLFFSAPWLLFAIPGAIRMKKQRPELIVCASIAVLFVWLNASLVDWQGGWAMGARYLVPCIPFLVLLAGGTLLGRVHIAIAALALALVAYSGVAMLAGTAVKPEVNVVVKKPFQKFIYPRFFAGDLAVSTQSIDSRGEAKNGPRQAWNLGEKLGLGGLASLIPLLLWCGACGALLVHSSRGTHRA